MNGNKRNDRFIGLVVGAYFVGLAIFLLMGIELIPAGILSALIVLFALVAEFVRQLSQ